MDLIVEEKAKQIADRWGDAVVNHLRARVPRASGALASAMLKRTPPQRVGHGWVVGIGDMELIGAGPFDAPPRNTISAFLEMWYKEAGGAQEVSDRKTAKGDRLKAREEKIKRRADEIEAVKGEREWWRKSDEKLYSIERSLGKAGKGQTSAELHAALAVGPEVKWRIRRGEAEVDIRTLERTFGGEVLRVVKGKDVWVETYQMKRLRTRVASAIAREKMWADRVRGHQKRADEFKTAIRTLEAQKAAELARRLKYLNRQR